MHDQRARREAGATQGAFIPDIAIAGGFSTEDHVFKVLAMGAPHTKAVCMGRALMIPGFVGKNIEMWMQEQRPAQVRLASSATTKEEIFVTYETLKAKYGAEVDKFPLGAIGVYTYSDKIKVGLQQLMSGSAQHAARHDHAATTSWRSRARPPRSPASRT